MLKKLKNVQVNYTLVAFLCFVVKVLAVNATIADAIILLGLGGVYAYTQYLKKFQTYKLEDAIVKDLLEVKSALSKLNMIRATEKMQDKKYF